MNTDGNKSATGSSVMSLRVATLVLGLILAMIVVIAMMPGSSTAQVSAKKTDPKAPPGYDPNAAESVEVPLQFTTVEGGAEGEITAQAISDTNCTSRLDKPHASKHSGYTKIGAYIGLKDCTNKKRRIYAKIAIQKWDWTFGQWRNFKVKETNSYGTYRNVKYASKSCPSGYRYYRSALLSATIYDYDGDVHRMIIRRFGNANQAACNGV